MLGFSKGDNINSSRAAVLIRHLTLGFSGGFKVRSAFFVAGNEVSSGLPCESVLI